MRIIDITKEDPVDYSLSDVTRFSSLTYKKDVDLYRSKAASICEDINSTLDNLKNVIAFAKDDYNSMLNYGEPNDPSMKDEFASLLSALESLQDIYHGVDSALHTLKFYVK